ncbi:DNA repair protein RecN [Rhabdothermincola sp.]|uniref:DNA repair protein RecN n=1 Tax=Rhabdothermincola sp. TaxID=2820405 RepID=UPI002FE28D9A
MLEELAVSDLGVIEHVSLVLGPGMTVLTGETGAGKTMLVDALELLVGGRADPTVVRPGATEALVEGRFVTGDEEIVLRRVIPREGRSRAYVNGRLATVSELSELGRALVDLHGQHAHQSLLAARVQRGALDRFGQVDLSALAEARQRLAHIDEQLAALGGDERERARLVDLLRFQVAEIDTAAIVDPTEDEQLEAEEEVLAGALEHREAAEAALTSLSGDGGAVDGLGAAIRALDGRAPFAPVEQRLRGLAAELADVASDLRATVELIEEDPARLEQVRSRRKLLHDLRRKYGDTLTEVLAFREEASSRLDALMAREATAARLEAERQAAWAAVTRAERAVGRARRRAAPALAEAVQANLRELALAKARLEVQVGDDPGDEVTILLSTNPGSPLLPLSKVASGGELARTMLALRLVLTEAPDTLVFDEVDAGIGGEAATAVGRALAALGDRHQVLVVTHLAQVAAVAARHVVVTKRVQGEQTSTTVREVGGEDRAVELARMLSGSPDSESARQHARELLGSV